MAGQEPDGMTDFFSELPFFRHLSNTTRSRLLHASLKSHYEAGSTVFRKGQKVRGLYLLQEGSAELRFGIENHIIVPGVPFGGAALFHQLVAEATLVVTEPATLWLLPRESFQEIIQHAQATDANARQACARYFSAQYVHTALHFPGQRDDERVLLFRRRHLWALCRKLWLLSLLIALVVAFGIWSSFVLSSILLMLIASIFAGTIGIYQFVEWWNDSLIVSNRRVIHIARTILGLQTQVSETALGNLQQVSADFPRRDPLARLLNYGTLELRTTGDAGSIRIRHMSEPRTLQQEIMSHCSMFDSGTVIGEEAIEEEILWQNEIMGLTGEESSMDQPVRMDSVANGATSTIEPERIYRKHVWVWLGHIWLGAVIFFIGLALSLTWPVWPPLQSLGGIGLAMSFCIMVVGGLWMYLMDWDWRHDLLILGENTITLHHRRPLWLQSERDEILLERVDNVTSRSVGLLQTLWNFGEIRLALMGDDSEDVKRFSGVPQPQRIQHEISSRRERLLEAKEQRAHELHQAIHREAMSQKDELTLTTPIPATNPQQDSREGDYHLVPMLDSHQQRQAEDLPQPPPIRPDQLPEV